MNWACVNFKSKNKGHPRKSAEYKSCRRQSLLALKKLHTEMFDGNFAKAMEELEKPVVELSFPSGRKCKVVLVILINLLGKRQLKTKVKAQMTKAIGSYTKRLHQY